MKWGKVVSWLLALSLALPAGAPGRPAAALESEGAQAAAQDSGGYAADSYRRYLEDHPADDGQAVPEIILTADHLAGVEGEGLRKVDKDGKRAVECLSGNMATWSFIFFNQPAAAFAPAPVLRRVAPPPCVLPACESRRSPWRPAWCCAYWYRCDGSP